jgi:hypothetical protein
LCRTSEIELLNAHVLQSAIFFFFSFFAKGTSKRTALRVKLRHGNGTLRRKRSRRRGDSDKCGNDIPIPPSGRAHPDAVWPSFRSYMELASAEGSVRVPINGRGSIGGDNARCSTSEG